MATLTIEAVESRLSEVQCAICKKNTFGIDRRFQQPNGEWKGACMSCRYTFPVYTDMGFYLQTQPDLPYRLKEIACPSCELRGVDLNFRIIMSVRESDYFVTCRHCTNRFVERSTLEAFE